MTGKRARRIAEATLAVAPLVLLLGYFSPLPHRSSVTVDPSEVATPGTRTPSGAAMAVSSGFERQYDANYRICRYHGTEWETIVQPVRMSAPEAIETIQSDPKFTLVPLNDAATRNAAWSLLHSVAMQDTDRARVPMDFVTQGAQVLLAGEGAGGPALLMAMALPTSDDGSTLITMRLRDRDQLINLLTPPDPARLREELEQTIPLPAGTIVEDKIEHETQAGTTITYFTRQAFSEWEAAGFYKETVAGLDSAARAEESPVVLQTVRTNAAVVHLSHFSDGNGASSSVIKIVRARRG